MNMTEEFKMFLSQLSETNATLDTFTDFKKAQQNVQKIAVKLNQLNYLLGKVDLKKSVNELYAENPKVFEVLDILIAVRKEQNKKILNSKSEVVSIQNYFLSVENIIQYIEQTGLAEIFKNKDITNLVDYVFGIKVGLDTHGRKNRGGENMSKVISDMLDKHDILYKKEVKNTDFIEITSLGVDVKYFDFVIKTQKKTYLIETNYYNSGGSKLNEVARSYTDLALKINQYPKYEFVWITDGPGWFSAKNKLEEAFLSIPGLYNLKSIKEFIVKIQKEKIISQW